MTRLASHSDLTPPPSSASAADCIGVFDSGLGGLSVLRALRAQLPEVPLCYVADSAHAPYGGRSTAYIQERSLRLGAFLIAQGAQVLVVACNTATTQAVAALRAEWPALPIVGVEPGVKPAAAASASGRIGVLATQATVDSARFAHLVKEHASGLTVVAQACPGLVELIETGTLDSPALRAQVARHCQPLIDAQVDTVVLGCTHYPFIRPLFEQAFKPNAGTADTPTKGQVLIVDTEAAISRQAAKLWQGLPDAARKLMVGTPPLRLFSTGNAQVLSDFAAKALPFSSAQGPSAQNITV